MSISSSIFQILQRRIESLKLVYLQGRPPFLGVIDVVWDDDQVVNFHLPSHSLLIHLALCHCLWICNDDDDKVDNDQDNNEEDDIH